MQALILPAALGGQCFSWFLLKSGQWAVKSGLKPRTSHLQSPSCKVQECVGGCELDAAPNFYCCLDEICAHRWTLLFPPLSNWNMCYLITHFLLSPTSNIGTTDSSLTHTNMPSWQFPLTYWNSLLLSAPQVMSCVFVPFPQPDNKVLGWGLNLSQLSSQAHSHFSLSA